MLNTFAQVCYACIAGLYQAEDIKKHSALASMYNELYIDLIFSMKCFRGDHEFNLI